MEVRLPTEYQKAIEQLGAAREKALQVCCWLLDVVNDMKCKSKASSCNAEEPNNLHPRF